MSSIHNSSFNLPLSRIEDSIAHHCPTSERLEDQIDRLNSLMVTVMDNFATEMT
jgi:hypothetical protein